MIIFNFQLIRSLENSSHTHKFPEPKIIWNLTIINYSDVVVDTFLLSVQSFQHCKQCFINPKSNFIGWYFLCSVSCIYVCVLYVCFSFIRGRFGQVHKCMENSSGLMLAAKIIKARSQKEKVQ